MAWKLIYGGSPVGYAMDDAAKADLVASIDRIISSGGPGWLKSGIAPGEQPYLEVLITAGIPIAFVHQVKTEMQPA